MEAEEEKVGATSSSGAPGSSSHASSGATPALARPSTSAQAPSRPNPQFDFLRRTPLLAEIASSLRLSWRIAPNMTG